jgi:hypothetical protein
MGFSPYRHRMKRLCPAIFAFAIIFATSVSAETSDALPSKMQVITALERKSGEDVADYMASSPNFLLAHALPPKALTELFCAPSAAPNQADCHFVAHYNKSKVYSVAALVRDGSGWRILNDHTVGIKSR